MNVSLIKNIDITETPLSSGVFLCLYVKCIIVNAVKPDKVNGVTN